MLFNLNYSPMKYELKKITGPSKNEGLVNEIKENLLFFIKTDLTIYGEITEATKKEIKIQGFELIEL